MKILINNLDIKKEMGVDNIYSRVFAEGARAFYLYLESY